MSQCTRIGRMAASWSIVALLLIGGCDPASPSGDNGTASPARGAVVGNADADGTAAAGRVALVDLDRIATATGKGNEIRAGMQQADQQAQQRIEALHRELSAKIQAQMAAAGENPTPQQRQQIEQVQREADQQMQALLTQVQDQIAQRQAQLVASYRQQIAPIAQEVARQRGFGIVMVRTDSILTHDPAADITDLVVQQLMFTTDPGEGQPAPQPSQMPAPSSRVPAPMQHFGAAGSSTISGGAADAQPAPEPQQPLEPQQSETPQQPPTAP